MMSAITQKEIEARARELGAKQKAIEKWRLRGTPAKWQLKLMAAYPDLKPGDFAADREAAE